MNRTPAFLYADEQKADIPAFKENSTVRSPPSDEQITCVLSFWRTEH
jgi:hypothetical protein